MHLPKVATHGQPPRLRYSWTTGGVSSGNQVGVARVCRVRPDAHEKGPPSDFLQGASVFQMSLSDICQHSRCPLKEPGTAD